MRMDTLGICLLLFAGAIIAWTGAFGPTNPTVLKDWQPLMAALTALAGGALAYRGAMAKIYDERERIERTEHRARLGAHLRLRYAATNLAANCARIRFLMTRTQMDSGREFATREQRRLLPNEAIDEAWQHLEWFSTDLAVSINEIRRFAQLQDQFHGLLGANVILTEKGSPSRIYFELLGDLEKLTREFSNKVSEELRVRFSVMP